MERVIDYVFFLYFASHIPITICVDSMAVFPRSLYPKQLTDVLDWYVSTYKDTMMGSTPVWMKTFCVFEVLVQFPFFFVAVYAFWTGISRNKWIRLPLLVYATHVATTVVPILAHILFHDFSGAKIPGPGTTSERLTLCGFYLPYLLVPLLLMVDTLFSRVYRTGGKKKTN